MPVRACVDQNRRPAYLTYLDTARLTDVALMSPFGRTSDIEVNGAGFDIILLSLFERFILHLWGTLRCTEQLGPAPGFSFVWLRLQKQQVFSFSIPSVTAALVYSNLTRRRFVILTATLTATAFTPWPSERTALGSAILRPE